MQIKHFHKNILIIFSALVLASCAGNKKTCGPDAGMNNAPCETPCGVQTAGVDQEPNFGRTGEFNGSISGPHRNLYYFDFDRSDIHEVDKPDIYRNANYLMNHPHAKIILEGHTDPRGSREYNVALGERRANAVAELMKMKGVNPGQIRIVSYGAERLAVPGRSENDYQLDRRVVVVIARK